MFTHKISAFRKWINLDEEMPGRWVATDKIVSVVPYDDDESVITTVDGEAHFSKYSVDDLMDRISDK